MGLLCTNCKKETDPQTAKFFGAPGDGCRPPYEAVFVCGECYAVAERFNQQVTAQLRSLLTIARESIRLAIIEQRLQLGPLPPPRELSKKDVFEQLLRIIEQRDVATEQKKAELADK